MNEAPDRLSEQLHLESPTNERLRFECGYACALRVKYLLEEPMALECLATLGPYIEGTVDRARLDQCAAEAARLPNQHAGSNSIDGCDHAAVSATYAVANALAGRARQAADYAAYAVVYGQGGYTAVAHRASFEPELTWQACAAGILVHAGQFHLCGVREQGRARAGVQHDLHPSVHHRGDDCRYLLQDPGSTSCLVGLF